jgi:hypothetical protein
VDPRELAIAHGRGRIAVGAALLVAPAAARGWIGPDAGRAGTKVFTRALGARDLALGLGVVIALDRGTPVRGWLEAGVLADVADFAATWLARHDIPPSGVAVTLAVAGGSTALGAWLARRLDPPPGDLPGSTPEAMLTGHPPERA